MKKFTGFSLFFFLSGFMLAACQREQGVHASNDRYPYQPRPAPTALNNKANHDLKGELVRVDMTGKTFAIRVANGMVQTLKFDDSTMVSGLANQPQTNTPKSTSISNTAVRNLVGKEGSELTVQWKDENGAKIATNIDVTQISTAKSTRHAGRRRS